MLPLRYYGEEEGYAQQMILQVDKQIERYGSLTTTIATTFDGSGVTSNPQIG